MFAEAINNYTAKLHYLIAFVMEYTSSSAKRAHAQNVCDYSCFLCLRVRMNIPLSDNLN
jgi:hypothetical protein